MTTDVKLLPLPEHMKAWANSLADDAQAYARANMEPLIAENERMREDLNAYASMVEIESQVAKEAEAKAERLAETLKWITSTATARDANDGMEEVETIKYRARAALDREGGK